jgi:hypothetical protein
VTTPHFPDAAGETDSLSVTPTLTQSAAETAGATDALTVGVTIPAALAENAAAADRLAVVKYLIPQVPGQAGLQVLNANPYMAGGSLTGWQAKNGTITSQAITPPGAFYQFGYADPGSGTSWTIPANNGAEVILQGDTALVQVSSATKSITGVKDTAGNSYSLVAVAPNQAGTMFEYLFAAYNCQAMGAADYVTVTSSANGSFASSAWGATGYLGRLAQAAVASSGNGSTASAWITPEAAGDTLLAVSFSPAASGATPAGWASVTSTSGGGYSKNVAWQTAATDGLTGYAATGMGTGSWGVILMDWTPANAQAGSLPGQAYAAQYENNGTVPGGIYATAASPLASGIGYLITAWVKSTSGSIQMCFDWYDGATFLSTSSVTISVPPGLWVQVPYAVPGGTSVPSSALSFIPHVSSAVADDVFEATSILVTAQQPLTAPIASPAFIKSQMPRMHIQNLITKQWYHRDVQGITSPTITWNLNNPDTFQCTLSPPRADMLDSTGNPFVRSWRDAVYLEENDTINFGGIVTESQFNGPQWTLTATGWAGYPSGTPYTGANYTAYNLDALDAVRFIWGWIQASVETHLGLQLDTAKAGADVGAGLTSLASTQLARSAASGQPYIWVWNAASLSNGMRITVNGIAYTIKTVMTNSSGTATGELNLGTNLNETHNAGEDVLQVQTWTTLARAAASGAAAIYVWDAAGFATGQVILIGTVPYTVSSVPTNSAGTPTGELILSSGLNEAHAAGEQIVLAPTPFQLLWYNTTDCGQEIQSIQQEIPFDWHEQHVWSNAAKTDVEHYLHFGVPRIGTRRSDLRFAEGENIIQPVQVVDDGSTFADNIIALGAGSGSAELRASASALSGQRLSRTQVYTDQTVLTQARLQSKAAKFLASVQNIDAPQQVTVKNHANAPFGSFMCGDDIPVTMCTGWRNTVIWCRVVSIAQDPTTDIATLTLARSDSYSYMAESGEAGTL